MTVRVRFAPSPTGHLHVGNVRTALFNWLYARKQEGVFILRIEDTDVERSTSESENIIYEDLKWIGLDWDEGPNSDKGFGPYRQSERTEVYKKYADILLAQGNAYRCFCTVEELEAERKKAADEGSVPRYNRKCLHLPQDEIDDNIKKGIPYSIRFKTPDEGSVVWFDVVKGKTEIPVEVVGDQIILRANGMPRYNFAVVVDDHLMEITHVVRGDDHVPNTPIQILIFNALGWELPKFAHLSMIVGPDHARLSKRHGATSINQFREEGYLPEAMLNHLALLSWSPGNNQEKLSVKELIDKFSFKRVSSSPAVFDRKKLDWLNSQYIREIGKERLAEGIKPFLQNAGYLSEDVTAEISDWLADFANAVKTDITTFRDSERLMESLVVYEPQNIPPESEEAKILLEAGVQEFLGIVHEDLRVGKLDSNERYREFIMRLMGKVERKGKALFQPIRVALTGRLSGMELDFFVPLVEKGSGLGFPKKIYSCAERLDILFETFYSKKGL
jgi:nondiscriminating glutamyl-tRNA synthetase